MADRNVNSAMMKNHYRLGALLCLFLLMLGCSEQNADEVASPAPIEWQLATSWPKGFPGVGHTAEAFAQQVNELSQGRLVIHVHGAGELLPSFDVFDAVSKGRVQMGHSAAYYWQNMIPAAPFFTAVPFGMNAYEMDTWLSQGNGLALWQDLYAPYGVIPLPGGNTGAQAGGWFQKDIQSLDDFRGMKMRMSGFASHVFQEVGGVPVNLPGGELFTALKTGAIDAAEWIGPYNDLAFGLQNAATYYYYPGWQEPSATMEFLINQSAYEALPADLREIIVVAADVVHKKMLETYTHENILALQVLNNEHDVFVKAFPPALLAELELASWAWLEQQSAQDASMARIYASYRQFLRDHRAYRDVTEPLTAQ
ncbi:TRAP transporter substrate-binding protein [Photobacterium aphoticum]|uniref:ABC transporter substrate-binding protein n=2 Tax=Photobacterium aphoticum TaxID=754436 RepID=A0A0J1GG47_9GAMM|nr:TRAP transporter substrate-binding protein [Photobacterium aphoticum]KLU98550.1 ABC transporter substrate-binding protein [Photobacterium aphoticum]